MIYGYARVSTDGQTVGAQVDALTAAGAAKVLRETASGAQTDRAQLRKALAQLDAGGVLLVTSTPRRKSQPAWSSHATSGLPFIVQRNGFAMVALK